MKKLLLFPVLALCTILMATCQKKDSPAPASFSMEKIFENDTLTVYKTDKGYTVSDTILRTDVLTNYIQHHIFVADQQGRPFAIGICDNDNLIFEMTKYLYDKKGNVRGLVIYDTSDDQNEKSYTSYDDLVADSIFNSQFDIDSDNFDARKILFDLMFIKSDDEPYFTRYYFLRDSQNRIVKVYDPILHNSVAAPEGYHIEYHIEFVKEVLRAGLPILGKGFTFDINDKNAYDEYDYGFYKYPDANLEIYEDEDEDD